MWSCGNAGESVKVRVTSTAGLREVGKSTSELAARIEATLDMPVMQSSKRAEKD